MGGIGTGADQHSNRRLVGDYPRLPVRAIPKWGTTTVEWPQGVARALLTRLTPTAVLIEAGGLKVEVELRQWPMPTVRGRQRGIRTRMFCVRCGAVRDALHWIPEVGWGCRGKNCLAPDGLAYPCRHKQKYCPAIARRARLWRKLARVSSRSLKARVLRKMIARETRAVLAHMEHVNNALDKRSKRHARHHGRANPERT